MLSSPASLFCTRLHHVIPLCLSIAAATRPLQPNPRVETGRWITVIQRQATSSGTRSRRGTPARVHTELKVLSGYLSKYPQAAACSWNLSRQPRAQYRAQQARAPSNNNSITRKQQEQKAFSESEFERGPTHSERAHRGGFASALFYSSPVCVSPKGGGGERRCAGRDG